MPESTVTRKMFEEISALENETIKNAAQNYGAFFNNCYDLVNLVRNAFEEISATYWIMVGFYGQIQKGLTLSVLSTLRQHDVQACLMLRNVLENLCLAAYSIEHTDGEEYAYYDDLGLLQYKKPIKEKAYKWLKANHEQLSDKIQGMKDAINHESSHANFNLIFINFEIHSSDFNLDVFDGHTDDPEHISFIIKSRLWWIGNICLGVLSLLNQIFKDKPGITYIPDYSQRLQSLSYENGRLHEELKKLFAARRERESKESEA